MVFYIQNWSDLLLEKIVLLMKILGQEITRTIHSNSERSVQFFKQKNAFLPCSWKFLLKKIRIIRIQIGEKKSLGFRSLHEKLEKTLLIL